MKQITMLYFIIITLIIFMLYDKKTIKIVHATPAKEDTDTISVPMFNYNTQRVEPFSIIGTLYKLDGDIVLPLYGRETHVRSTRWNYYTYTDSHNKIRINLTLNGDECMDKRGCKELFDDDVIHIPELNSKFKVSLY